MDQNGAFWSFGCSDQGLRVPVVTSGPRIDPRETLSWIIDVLRFIYNPLNVMNKTHKSFQKMKEIKIFSQICLVDEISWKSRHFCTESQHQGCDKINKGGKNINFLI